MTDTKDFEALRLAGPAMIISDGHVVESRTRRPCHSRAPCKAGRSLETYGVRFAPVSHRIAPTAERPKLGQATQTCTALLVLPRHAGRCLPLGL